MKERAIQFATEAHGDQARKYCGSPYITHPIAVAKIVESVEHTEEMVVAAILHDVVEDTPVTIDEIETEFGPVVAELVHFLTDISVLGLQMNGLVIFIAWIVWVVSYLRLPKMSFPQVNMVQRFNFATINAILVLIIYMVIQYD